MLLERCSPAQRRALAPLQFAQPLQVRLFLSPSFFLQVLSLRPHIFFLSWLTSPSLLLTPDLLILRANSLVFLIILPSLGHVVGPLFGPLGSNLCNIQSSLLSLWILLGYNSCLKRLAWLQLGSCFHGFACLLENVAPNIELIARTELFLCLCNRFDHYTITYIWITIWI